jgi:hypothetical protein
MTTKILSPMQAANVFNAMCELNNIGAHLHARILTPNHIVHVKEYLTDEVNVWIGDASGNPLGDKGVERYANQSEFRDAYGLGD